MLVFSAGRGSTFLLIFMFFADFDFVVFFAAGPFGLCGPLFLDDRSLFPLSRLPRTTAGVLFDSLPVVFRFHFLFIICVGLIVFVLFPSPFQFFPLCIRSFLFDVV